MTKEWEKPEDLRRRKPVLWLTMTALFMAMVVVLSMSALSIPVPGGHLYFNDVVIDTAAMLMDPLSAFIACGVGAFRGGLVDSDTLGRAFVYSTPEYAIMKLPFQCLQAGVGAVTSWILCCPLGLTRRFHSIVK